MLAEATLRIEVKTHTTVGGGRFLSALVRQYLENGLGLTPDLPETSRIRIAIVGVLNNVQKHAYAGRGPGPVTLTMERSGGKLTVEIRDAGPPFDPTAAGRGVLLPPEELQEGGYGLGILSDVMDEIRHRHEPGTGNVLTLTTRVPEIPPHGPGAES
jgi:anti-sigma regulatory factor (Ser/Thr protein kinase)